MEECGREIPVFQAANMSLGINLLKLLIKKAAAILGETFDIEIIEKHHRMKKDAPSGTALALADALKEVLPEEPDYVHGRQEKDRLRTDQEIGIHAIRGGTIVGEHEVIFAGQDEVLELSHKAYSRRLFASGAIKAAVFMTGQKPGIYHMEDMLSEMM
jgi:4-hydroxy-tetrahydrodipicolinate reductase